MDQGLKVVIWVVTTIWALSMLLAMASAAFPGTFPVRYSVEPAVHGILMAVVGAASGVKVMRGGSSGAS